MKVVTIDDSAVERKLCRLPDMTGLDFPARLNDDAETRRVSMEPLALGVNQAIPAGLILNELHSSVGFCTVQILARQLSRGGEHAST